MERREATLQCRLRNLSVPQEDLVGFTLDLLGALDADGAVGIRIVSERTMAGMNRRYRAKSGATDVLSFPSGEEEEPGMTYLGDIAICGPVAAQAARTEGIRLERELKRLVLHGVLHLLGYDHEADNGRMVRKERALRKKLGI